MPKKAPTKKAPTTNAPTMTIRSPEGLAQVASALSWFALGVILILLAFLAYDYVANGYGLHPIAALGVAGVATILCALMDGLTKAQPYVIEGQDLPIALPLNRKV